MKTNNSLLPFGKATTKTKFFLSKTKNKLLILLMSVFLASAVQVHAQTTRYVKPTATGAGTGATWADASADIQAMITASAANDIVWVAAGTYKPTTNPVTGAMVAGDRYNTFYLKNEVKVYGSFAGTETALSQRNITANPTILSGDFLGDDNVSGTSATLSITGNTENAYHVVLSVSDNANTVLDGFSIKGGNAIVVSGGNITVEGLTVFTYYGGGMYNRNSSPSITNCVFSGNKAYIAGGMYNTTSSPFITNCIFSGNIADSGGGMLNSGSSSLPSFVNCVFSDNKADINGGGMYNEISSSSLTNCVFSGNYSTNDGGGMFNFLCNPIIKNTIIQGNTSGGIQGIFNTSSSPIITFSNVQGITASGNNISSDPLFVNAADADGADNIFMTADDGLKIQSASPCKDTGTNTGAPLLDILGISIFNTTKDMGAYEFFVCPTITNSIAQNNLNCFGGTNGIVGITSPSGGTAPYTYLWSNGASTAFNSGLAVGTYTCTITDANGCTKIQSFTLTEPPVLTNTFSQTNVSCFGGANGTATVVASGGIPSYTYSWSNGQTSATATGLAAGTYTCTITDASGSCTKTQSFTITAPTAITNSALQNNVSCFGGSNGVVGVSAVSGGVAPYTYLWSNGAITSFISGRTAGTYTCTITDANGCQKTQSVTITEPATAITNTFSQTNVSCLGGANGTATVVASGGTAAYTYSWSFSSVTLPTRSGLAAGTYVCTITDANSCQRTQSFTITEPTFILVSISRTNVSCRGGSNGTATMTASGGTSPYTYLWSNGATTSTTTGLIAGTYSCTITDANSCTNTQNVAVTQPAAILSNTFSQTNNNCFGGANGTATVVASGGTGAYSYVWSNGQTSATASGLAVGTYTCTITDANGCQKTQSFTIGQPSFITSFISAQTNVLCRGGSSGSATLTVSGGTGSYTYLWSNGATSATASGLIAGTYNCTITDANGCSSTRPVIITEPATAITNTFSQTNNNCFGDANGTATVVASGGTGAYTYSWSSSSVTLPTRSGLVAGTYTCTITDANGCQKTQSFTITQPATITNGFSQTNVSCFGGNNGTASVFGVSGGAAPYTYLWSNSATSATASGLTFGTYTCTITDANSCQKIQSFTLTQLATITNGFSQTNVSCFGGSNGTASVFGVSGGAAPYTYLWSNSATSATASGLTFGTYTCTITDANGCTKTQSFTITQPATAIVINPVSLTNGTVGSIYSQIVTQTGLTGTPVWSTTGTLPNGVSIAPTTGIISGTPTTAGTFNFMVSVTDGVCSQTRNYSVVIACPTVAVTPTLTSQSYVVGTAINNITLGASGVSGATYTYAVTSGALPAGVTLSAGVISGTPTTSVGGTFTITATSNIGTCTGTAVYNFGVFCPFFTFTNTTATSATIGTAYSLNAGVTGNTQSVVYSVSPSLPAGLSLGTATGAISGTPTIATTSATYTVTATQGTCTTMQGYTFAVSCPIVVFGTTSASFVVGGYNIFSFNVTGNTGALSYSVSPTLPAGLSISGGFISGIATASLSATNYTITATQGTCISTQVFSIAVTCPPIVFGNATAPTFVVGVSNGFGFNLTGNTSTVTYSVSPSLPAGLVLDVSFTGSINGTPTVAAPLTTYTITATQGTCAYTQDYTFAVICPPIVFTNTTAISATVGTAYSLDASVTGNTASVVYSVSSLPTGLILDTATGIISGTPTTPTASVTYTVTATQGTCSVTQGYTFAVACVGITIIPTTLANGIVGTAYTQTATQTGLTGTAIWSTTGTLPNGLSIDSSTGIISGTPTTAGTFAFVVSVTDGACSQTANYSVVVACPSIVITNNTVSNAIIGISYTINTVVSGNTSVLSYSILPSLPAGLIINPVTGVISGVPSVLTAVNTYVVTASQTVGCFATISYTFGVIPACSSVVLGLTSIPNATIGTPYSQTFTATGGTTGATYAFTTTSPQLAGTGLTLSTAGILSGTPTFSTSITFRVTATTTPNSCTGFKDYTFVINPNPATSVDNALANLVKVSPNPSSGDFNVDFGSINMAKSSVSVYDAQGKVVFTSENNSNLMTISLDKFANGIYLLELKTSIGRITKRLSKTN